MTLSVLRSFAISTVFFLGCHRKEEVPEIPPQKPEVTKPSPLCIDPSYSLTAGEQKILICHKDAQSDQIFQANADQLRWWDGNRFVSFENQAELANFQNRFGFPNFEGLNLSKWRLARERVFPAPSRDWTLK